MSCAYLLSSPSLILALTLDLDLDLALTRTAASASMTLETICSRTAEGFYSDEYAFVRVRE